MSRVWQGIKKKKEERRGIILNIFVYAIFTYALMALIAVGVVGIIVGVSKVMNKPGKGDNK